MEDSFVIKKPKISRIKVPKSGSLRKFRYDLSGTQQTACIKPNLSSEDIQERLAKVKNEAASAIQSIFRKYLALQRNEEEEEEEQKKECQLDGTPETMFEIADQ